MSSADTSIEWPAVLLGCVGTAGAVLAAVHGKCLWAGVIFVGSIVAELVVALVRRRR